MKTPVQILLRVVSIGGQLDIVNGRLRMLLPPDCPPELKDEIRHHKSFLVSLMRLAFAFRSDVLNSIIFFVADDTTKESLVAAGADLGSIYTRAELEMLVRRRITPTELRLIHAAKQRFNAKVTNP